MCLTGTTVGLGVALKGAGRHRLPGEVAEPVQHSGMVE